jgi:predicted Fe-S protein YdhL (DUF1289 family)
MTQAIQQDMALSPCIKVCALDSGNKLCLGCFRTLDEIALWSRIANDERLNILTAARQRREQLKP